MIISDGKKMAGISYLAQLKECNAPHDCTNDVLDAIIGSPVLNGTNRVYIVDDVDEEIKYWENNAKEDTEAFNKENEEEGWTKRQEDGCWRPTDGGRYFSDEVPGDGYRVEYDVEYLEKDHAAQEEKFVRMGY